MKLKEFAAHLSFQDETVGEINIDHIALDSRLVKAGTLFAALPGEKVDGSQFIKQAIEKGSVAILTGHDATVGHCDVPGDVPVFRVDDPRQILAHCAAIFYQKQPETMVAVTGTSGKTSVVSFLRQIWERVGLQAASIGTTGVRAPHIDHYGSLTTPDTIALHQMLADLKDHGVTHCAMEASSHGLDQCRLDGVRLKAGGFTNLGRDHMDYHPTVEHYHNAKMGLFTRLLPSGSPAVIYSDDEWSQPTIAAAKQANMQVLTVGRAGNYLALKRLQIERHRQRGEIVFEGRSYEVNLPLAGGFQMANALVAAGLAIATGANCADVFSALEYLQGASGRLEKIGTTRDGALVYVDYAHKPDALEHVLKAVRPFTTGKVFVVFGCGGDRDPGKRSIMGEVASRLADTVIVTDDNPRSEDGGQIRATIMRAAPRAMEIGDRGEAIRYAVNQLGAGDTLIVAGKGHETGQIVGKVTLPFNDHEELRSALLSLGGNVDVQGAA